MMSPGFSGRIADRRSMREATEKTEKMRSLVRARWTISPLTLQPISRSSRSADAELRRRADQLAGPFGEVVPDRDAGDVIPCPGRVDADGTPPDDDDQLRLPVHGGGRQDDDFVRAGDGGLELGEHGRFRW